MCHHNNCLRELHLGDSEEWDWELIRPSSKMQCLFLNLDELFFNSKLHSRVLLRWSKRMYSSAGVCSYDESNGLCMIALSEPLLKLRPRKDVIETLLHEMIHAFLIVTNSDDDRDCHGHYRSHGPNFQFHMHRINRLAELKISIYHNFRDEVKFYLPHMWRCNGRCQKFQPHFGVVRLSSNRAPGILESWWGHHKRICGGTFIKIQESQKKQLAIENTEEANTNSDRYNNIIKKNNVEFVNIEDNKHPPLLSTFDCIIKTNVNSTSTVVDKAKVMSKNKIPTNSPVSVRGLSATAPQTQSQNTTKNKRKFTYSDESPIKKTKINDLPKQIDNICPYCDGKVLAKDVLAHILECSKQDSITNNVKIDPENLPFKPEINIDTKTAGDTEMSYHQKPYIEETNTDAINKDDNNIKIIAGTTSKKQSQICPNSGEKLDAPFKS